MFKKLTDLAKTAANKVTALNLELKQKVLNQKIEAVKNIKTVKNGIDCNVADSELICEVNLKWVWKSIRFPNPNQVGHIYEMHRVNVNDIWENPFDLTEKSPSILGPIFSDDSGNAYLSSLLYKNINGDFFSLVFRSGNFSKPAIVTYSPSEFLKWAEDHLEYTKMKELFK